MSKKYKICILGNTGNDISKAYSWFVKTTYEGMVLNGHEVKGFDYKTHTIDQIRNFLFDYNPDIIFTHLTMHKHHDKFDVMEIFDNLRSLNDTKIIHTMQDARENPRYSGDISHAFDMAFVAQTENIPKFSKLWNIPVYYWPYSSLTYMDRGIYRSNLDFKKPVFPGNPSSHNDRTLFIQKLQKHLDFKIIQTKSKDDVRDKTLDFSASTPCVLGLCTGYDISGYGEVRWVQFGGAGAILIMRKFKEMIKYFPEKIDNKRLYFGFDDYNHPEVVKSLWEKINKMSNTEKNIIKQNVFNFIQTYHSSKIRMKQTIEVIEGKKDKLNIFLNDLEGIEEFIEKSLFSYK